jgi:hypothetical protein
MSFTYDPADLSTGLAKLRLAIGDTTEGAGVRPDGSNFSDEELQVFLDSLAATETWRNAAPAVMRVLANQYAAAAKRTSDAEISEDLTRTAAELRAQAREYEQTITATGAAASGGFTAGVISFGSYVYEIQSDGTVV